MSAIKLKIKKLNKFQCGQLIFIFAITAGPFFEDTVRNILLLLSIFCMSKRDFTQQLRASWTGKYKLYGYALMLLWAMLLFIPFAFGVDDLKERFAGLGWPIEMIIWMWAAQVFARDTFFIKSLKNASIAVCGIYSLIALPIVLTNGDIYNYGKFGIWPLTQTSFATGCVLCCLIVWIIYRLFAENDSNKSGRALLFCIFALTLLTILLTFRRTFWFTAIAELVAAAPILLLTSKEKFNKYIKGFGILCAGSLILFSLVVIQDNPVFENLLKKKWQQVTSIGNNETTKFLTYRNLVWHDAVDFIKERPFTGYGYAEYGNFTKDFPYERCVGHAHSTFLQMAWTAGIFPCVLFIIIFMMLLYICITELKKRGSNCSLPFVVLLVLIAFVTSGLFEDLFKNTRRATMLYWIYLSLPLSKAFVLSISAENNAKSFD
ncbi:MAG: O-antigen ligase family protein [Synergistes sp.]|nr:O-antigen ligase family protein [Synergistes sp.]